MRPPFSYERTTMTKQPLWIHRRLLNWQNVYQFGIEAGVKKMMPPEQLHMTLATVREPVEWGDLKLRQDKLIIPTGHKAVQIFAYTIKALTFGHPDIKSRHEELLEMFPMMDHPLLRPHVSLYKGGRMPKIGYEGELVFGPEQADVFDAANTAGIKHVKIADMLADLEKTS